MVVVFVYSGCENLGIEYLSAVLKAAGHETFLLYDPRLFENPEGIPRNRFLARIFDEKKILLRKLDDYRPDLVAFSVVSADYLWACKVAAMIKERMDVPIVFGNIHPTAVPEVVIRNDFVDYVVIGEGEYALLDLVNDLKGKKRDYTIPNVWFKRGGEVISNPPRPLIQDLDSLPFPDRDLYYRVGKPFDFGLNALARRGCKNACTYCSNSVRRKIYFGRDYLKNNTFLRMRSVRNFISELKEAKEKYHFTLVRFNDDDFIEDERWLKEFSEIYPREVGVPYKCFANPESVSETAVSLLEKSGCGQVQMGIQSLNPVVRQKSLRRYHANEELARAVDLFRDSPVQLLADNLLGVPRQTEKDSAEMVRFYVQHPATYVNAYWLLYFAGHDVVKIARKYNLITDRDIQSMENAPFTGTHLDRPGVQPRRLVKYQTMVRLMNYFPRALSRFMVEHDLYRFLPPFDFIFVLRIFRMLMKSPKKDVFPDPRDVYEVVGLRRREEYLFHIVRKMKHLLKFKWLRRKG